MMMLMAMMAMQMFLSLIISLFHVAFFMEQTVYLMKSRTYRMVCSACSIARNKRQSISSAV
jgi:hypothetical protein